VFVQESRLLSPDDRRLVGEDGIRRQPFALYLRSAGLSRWSVLHCVSPVGKVQDVDPEKIIEIQGELHGAKLCQVPSNEATSYTLTKDDNLAAPFAFSLLDEADSVEEPFGLAVPRKALDALNESLNTF